MVTVFFLLNRIDYQNFKLLDKVFLIDTQFEFFFRIGEKQDRFLYFDSIRFALLWQKAMFFTLLAFFQEKKKHTNLSYH